MSHQYKSLFIENPQTTLEQKFNSHINYLINISQGSGLVPLIAKRNLQQLLKLSPEKAFQAFLYYLESQQTKI